MMSVLRNKIRETMKSTDTTMETLSRRTGVSIPSISKFLSGKECTTKTLERILEGLGLKIEVV